MEEIKDLTMVQVKLLDDQLTEGLGLMRRCLFE
jgi:hypothetical protein